MKWSVALTAMLAMLACQPDTAQTPVSDGASADARFEDNSESPDLAPDAYQTARRPYTAWGGEVELYFTRPGTQRGEEEDPEADDAIANAIHDAQVSVDLCQCEYCWSLFDAFLPACSKSQENVPCIQRQSFIEKV